MSEEKRNSEIFKEEATSETGKKWIDKAVELAKKEGLKIYDVEEYEWGYVIRFAFTDDPKTETDVYIWYKKVEWLGASSFCGLAETLFSSDELDRRVSSILETMAISDEIITGYRMEVGRYNGFVKDVETPEEAVQEVKRIIPKTKEVSDRLDIIVGDIRESLEDFDRVME